MHDHSPTTVRAHAKLNLLLSVGSPEGADAPRAGWHRILSWFTCIDLYDDIEVITLRQSDASRYEVAWAEDAPLPASHSRVIDWAIEKDLCVRAHRAFESHIKKSVPVHVRVRKRVPTGAGLGGGSSDAGALLGLLRELFAAHLEPESMQAVGASIGSDVAYFIDDRDPPRSAIVSGFGETIERVDDLVRGEVVLVIPPFSCSTPAVYHSFDELLAAEQRDEALRRAARKLTGPERSWGPREQLVRGRVQRMIDAGRVEPGLLFNDLEKAAFRVEPRLGELSRAISRVTRMDAHLTGSGSCLFLVPPAGRIEWVIERVRLVAPGANVLATRLLA
jgi:4-diphosphocytidyl-2-C-methyl-D-erythritol kinase